MKPTKEQLEKINKEALDIVWEREIGGELLDLSGFDPMDAYNLGQDHMLAVIKERTRLLKEAGFVGS